MLLHHLTTRFGALKYQLLIQATGAGRVLGLDNGRGNFLTDRVLDHGFGVHHESDYWLQVAALLGIEASGRLAVASEAPPVILPDKPLVAIHPGSGAYAPARRWPVSRWAALADALIADGVAVVLVGGPEEALLRETMRQQMVRASSVQDVGGKTTVPQLAGLLGACDLFLGGDSGVVHLAAAAGTPVVAPYGPTDPRAWGPWSGAEWQTEHTFENGVAVLKAGPHRTLQAQIACSPCIYRGHGLGTPQGCPDRTCLERITVEQMLEVVRNRLQQREALDATR